MSGPRVFALIADIALGGHHDGDENGFRSAVPSNVHGAPTVFDRRSLATKRMASTVVGNPPGKALDEELRAAITTEVNSKILPKLHDRFQSILGWQQWELAPSKDESEEMTLLFHYPNAFEYSSYLRPQIKIEFGRGDQQPSEKSSVTPFVTEMFPDIFREKSAAVNHADSTGRCRNELQLQHKHGHSDRSFGQEPQNSGGWNRPGDNRIRAGCDKQ